MTQDERNRVVHEKTRRAFDALSLEERIQRLIDYGLLTPGGEIAPEYLPPPGFELPEDERPPLTPNSKSVEATNGGEVKHYGTPFFKVKIH